MEVLEDKKVRGKTTEKCYICRQKAHFAKKLFEQIERKKSSIKFHFKMMMTYLILSQFSLLTMNLFPESPSNKILRLWRRIISSSSDSDDYTREISTIDSPELLFFINQPILLARIQLLSLWKTNLWDRIFWHICSIHNHKSIPSSSLLLETMLVGALSCKQRKICDWQISKPILVRFSPNFTVQHKAFVSNLPGKDLFIGFDVIHKFTKLKMI